MVISTFLITSKLNNGCLYMNTPRLFQGFVIRFIIIGVLLSSVTTCTNRVHIGTAVPQVYVQKKIPFKVVLVIPDDLNKHECTFWAIREVIFDCGNALNESTVKTIETLFMNVDTVSKITEVSAPWDRVLWIEIEEFRLSGSFIENTNAYICMNYNVMDNQNNETFSSSITVKRYHSMQREFPLQFIDSSNSLDNEDSDFPLLVVMIPTGEGQDVWGKNLIEEAIEELMIKFANEITDAYEKQLL